MPHGTSQSKRSVATECARIPKVREAITFFFQGKCFSSVMPVPFTFQFQVLNLGIPGLSYTTENIIILQAGWVCIYPLGMHYAFGKLKRLWMLVGSSSSPSSRFKDMTSWQTRALKSRSASLSTAMFFLSKVSDASSSFVIQYFCFVTDCSFLKEFIFSFLRSHWPRFRYLLR